MVSVYTFTGLLSFNLTQKSKPHETQAPGLYHSPAYCFETVQQSFICQMCSYLASNKAMRLHYNLNREQPHAVARFSLGHHMSESGPRLVYAETETLLFWSTLVFTVIMTGSDGIK